MGRLSLAEVDAAREAPGRSVLLFITDRCPVGCAHCSVDSRADSPSITDFELFGQILDAICARPEVRVVGISGGEPFVERRGLMVAAHKVVDAGKDLVLYTSGVWAKSNSAPAWIRDVVGIASCVFLSTDAFHAEQIADEQFIRAARTISGEGVPIVVQVLDNGVMIERARELLLAAFGASWAEHAEINLIPPLPYGRGATVFMRGAGRSGRDYGRCRVAVELVAACDRRLHQRHARAHDAVHRAEVLGIELADARAVPDPPRGCAECGQREPDLLPEPLARGHSSRACPTRSSATIIGSGRSSSPRRATRASRSGSGSRTTSLPVPSTTTTWPG